MATMYLDSPGWLKSLAIDMLRPDTTVDILSSIVALRALTVVLAPLILASMVATFFLECSVEFF